MKGKMNHRLSALLLVGALAAGALVMSVCADAVPCKTCADEGLEFKGFTATTEFGRISDTQCARYYICNNGHKQLTHDPDGSFRDVQNHSVSKNPTCTESAYCGDCQTYFGSPLGHQVVTDQAVAPTCQKTGLTEGSHCGRCGEKLVPQTVVDTLEHSYDDGVTTQPTCFKEGFTTYTCKVCGTKLVTEKEKPLSHWYAEWEPAGKGQNSAPCKRSGCTHIKTTACVDWDFKLLSAGAEKAESYSVCPVCGELSDGGRLELVEDVKVTPITGWTPQGDLLFRMGALENGEKLICIGWEVDARLTQCTGKTRFAVPAELLEAHKLMLLADDGTETELELERKGDSAVFELNFERSATGSWVLVRMLHLVPVEA